MQRLGLPRPRVLLNKLNIQRGSVKNFAAGFGNWTSTMERDIASDTKGDVYFERFGTKGVITLNRPKRLNSFHVHMINDIHRKVKEWETDSQTSLIIIKGAGDKAFCAGGDLMTVTDNGKMGDVQKASRWFNEVYQFMYTFGTCKIPFIALIDGIVMGGGLGLSAHGKFRVATERTTFGVPEPAVGFFPDVGASHVLSRLKHNLGIYLAMTGFRLKGRDVCEAGIATHMVDSAKIPMLESELLELENSTKPVITKVLQKYHITCQTGRDKKFVLADRLDDISRLFAGDTVERIIENLEKEGSDWAAQQLQTLRKMSPTSLKLTLRQLRTGARMNLADCLRMESRMVAGCLRHHDFYEGVRIFVNRGQSPKWEPDTIEEVTEELIEDHFVLRDGMEDLILPP